MVFRDRAEAGRLLADKVRAELKPAKNTAVYALPRGGVAVAAEVARALHAPLDILVTRKIGHPFSPEYAVGASGPPILSQAEVAGLDPAWLNHQVEQERAEIVRRERAYAPVQRVKPKGKRAIIVDDGIATGLTMQAAIAELRAAKAKEIIVAVPVGPADTLRALKKQADRVIAVAAPTFFRGAIGNYYEQFDQVSDKEVKKMLGDS